MRTITNSFVMALVAITVVFTGDVACGRDLTAQQPATDELARSSVKAPLGIGDRLKISFYETIDVGDMKRGARDGSEPQGTLRTFYQRMDLSGEYVVEQDGAISIPLLGRFQVEGRALDDLQADLAMLFVSSTLMGSGRNPLLRLCCRQYSRRDGSGVASSIVQIEPRPYLLRLHRSYRHSPERDHKPPDNIG